jgi:hypothetical protein
MVAIPASPVIYETMGIKLFIFVIFAVEKSIVKNWKEPVGLISPSPAIDATQQ